MPKEWRRSGHGCTTEYIVTRFFAYEFWGLSQADFCCLLKFFTLSTAEAGKQVIRKPNTIEPWLLTLYPCSMVMSVNVKV